MKSIDSSPYMSRYVEISVSNRFSMLNYTESAINQGLREVSAGITLQRAPKCRELHGEPFQKRFW